MKNITHQNTENEYIVLEYANQEEIYVPIYRMDLISKYQGDVEHIELDRLGKTSWTVKKKQAQESIEKLAKELMKHYQNLKEQTAIPIVKPEEIISFAKNFPYEETPDQSQSINDILHRMSQTQLMDHLLCGDVGFGKTEVAMRAIFSCAFNQTSHYDGTHHCVM